MVILANVDNSREKETTSHWHWAADLSYRNMADRDRRIGHLNGTNHSMNFHDLDLARARDRCRDPCCRFPRSGIARSTSRKGHPTALRHQVPHMFVFREDSVRDEGQGGHPRWTGYASTSTLNLAHPRPGSASPASPSADLSSNPQDLPVLMTCKQTQSQIPICTTFHPPCTPSCPPGTTAQQIQKPPPNRPAGMQSSPILGLHCLITADASSLLTSLPLSRHVKTPSPASSPQTPRPHRDKGSTV